MTILKQDDRRAAKIASQAIARAARAPGTLVRAVGRALRPSAAGPSPSRELAPVRPALPPAPPPPAIDPDPIFAETASWAGRARSLSFIGAVVGPTFLAML